MPQKPVPRLTDLDDKELSCLMHSIRRVGQVVERVYDADALTIACQDGKAAGQSIPHVHFHILPRKFKGDKFEKRNDDIYPALENSGKTLSQDLIHVQDGTVELLKVDDDDGRLPRSMEEMEEEANWLRGFFV
ncbi:hypothetical protein APHAL10511_005934 [Amanita phalloides]|nr:hypothetical protein APHAL10511_005934 [Amanita phalloides]